jgi:energy-coupling factor transport system substrate-specific component
MKPVRRVALIGVLAAVNVASRVFLQFLPNVKPVTSIVILATIAFGLRFGIELAAATTLVSGILLGFGTYLPFQILGWCVIAGVTALLDKGVPSGMVWPFAAWAFFSGFVYGVFVSLDKLFISPMYFAVYYVNGFPFDALHAIGNLAFFPVCYFALLPIFRRQAAGSRFAGH